MTWKKFGKRLLLFCFCAAGLVLFLPQLVILQHAKNRILDLADLPPEPTAIVLGASVLPTGIPSAVLEDRISSAAELYAAGKVQKLLMSGDNSAADYDEVQVMKDRAIALGVPAADILTDDVGIRTYDSCAHAREVFDISAAIIVTQRFHLPRALYLCKKLGIESYGFAADKAVYLQQNKNETREFFARIQAFFEVNFFPNEARRLGEKIEEQMNN